MKRKLIEVALPLDAINAASAREKSIRHGHPSTLHLWWARRPLAACRAVLFAQLVDDPSSHPEEFPTQEDQDRERQRLFGIIEELVKWENTTNEEVLNAARSEILKSTDGNPPPILDPFAGGGSIPLEAQRLGLEAHASDLNPVAVLINKALIEIPPKWANMPPVHPEAEQRTHWRGAEGLAEDVRLFGKWIRDEAERRIGHLYPRAKLPDGSEASVIAWIWARTVTCPNPACGAIIPMLSSFWLGKKKGKEAWLATDVNQEEKAVSFKVRAGASGPNMSGNAGDAGITCLVCNMSHGVGVIRERAREEGLGSQMVAVAAEGERRRHYLDPDIGHIAASQVDSAYAPLPRTAIPDQALGFRVGAYGISEFPDMFTRRQSVLLVELMSLVETAARRVLEAGRIAGLSNDVAQERADEVAIYLALAVSRFSGRSSNLCIWLNQPKNEGVANVFTRPTLSMNWDYAEVNPFSRSSGNLLDNYDWIARVLEKLPVDVIAGTATLADARCVELDHQAISTDPPYYDNVGYADLSDFFYVPLRVMLASRLPDLFGTLQTPKAAELISDPSRHKDAGTADEFFETGFRTIFSAYRSTAGGNATPMTVFYAFKQSEKSKDALTSTGWATILQGLLDGGWSITATWPVRTERPGRMRANRSNALATSVVLTCRPRPMSAPLTDRQGLVRVLHERLPGALHEMQKANIAPVDLRQAAIGPGMAVFSSYGRVVEPDGEPMKVRTALGLINQVLDQILSEQEAEFDPETRWAIQWFSQFFGAEGPYGTAEQLAVAMNISVDGLRRSGILESGRGKVRLLIRDEYPDDWDPTSDDRTPVWEACEHLVKRLESDGEAAAGRLLAQLGGLGESAQLLAYRLYTVCEKSQPALAGPYNALVASWPQIQHHARMLDDSPSPATPEQQSFDA